MTPRLVSIVLEHPDGSITSHRWDHVHDGQVQAIEEWLGAPSYTTHLPAEAVQQLTPLVAQRTLIVDGEDR